MISRPQSELDYEAALKRLDDIVAANAEFKTVLEICELCNRLADFPVHITPAMVYNSFQRQKR